MALATSEAPTRNHRFEYVRVSDLKIDPAYHAPERFNEKRARAMAAAWDDDKAGTITVSLRDGATYLIDGNHRRFAASERGVSHLYAKVYFGLTVREEAGIFIGLSAAVPLGTLDLWQARRADRDPIVLGVEAILDKYGVRIARGGRASDSPHYTRSVGAFQTLFQTNPQLLDDTLGLVRSIWPEQRRALDSLVIKAIGSFLAAYRSTIPRLDEQRLRDRLSLTTPEDVHRTVKTLAAAQHGLHGTGGGISYHTHGQKATVASWSSQRRAVLAIYNRGLRHKLADLTTGDLRALADGRIVDLRDREPA